MHLWGTVPVSSAFEVALVLRRLLRESHDGPSTAHCRDLLSIPAPLWGGRSAAAAAARLAASGYRLWSWDDQGVTFTPPAVSSLEIAYLTWRELAAVVAAPAAPPR
jgi:hypothetical protein